MAAPHISSRPDCAAFAASNLIQTRTEPHANWAASAESHRDQAGENNPCLDEGLRLPNCSGVTVQRRRQIAQRSDFGEPRRFFEHSRCVLADVRKVALLELEVGAREPAAVAHKRSASWRTMPPHGLPKATANEKPYHTSFALLSIRNAYLAVAFP